MRDQNRETQRRRSRRSDRKGRGDALEMEMCRAEIKNDEKQIKLSQKGAGKQMKMGKSLPEHGEAGENKIETHTPDALEQEWGKSTHRMTHAEEEKIEIGTEAENKKTSQRHGSLPGKQQRSPTPESAQKERSHWIIRMGKHQGST